MNNESEIKNKETVQNSVRVLLLDLNERNRLKAGIVLGMHCVVFLVRERLLWISSTSCETFSRTDLYMKWEKGSWCRNGERSSEDGHIPCMRLIGGWELQNTWGDHQTSQIRYKHGKRDIFAQTLFGMEGHLGPYDGSFVCAYPSHGHCTIVRYRKCIVEAMMEMFPKATTDDIRRWLTEITCKMKCERFQHRSIICIKSMMDRICLGLRHQNCCDCEM